MIFRCFSRGFRSTRKNSTTAWVRAWRVVGGGFFTSRRRCEIFLQKLPRTKPLQPFFACSEAVEPIRSSIAVFFSNFLPPPPPVAPSNSTFHLFSPEARHSGCHSPCQLFFGATYAPRGTTPAFLETLLPDVMHPRPLHPLQLHYSQVRCRCTTRQEPRTETRPSAPRILRYIVAALDERRRLPPPPPLAPKFRPENEKRERATER